MESKYYIPEKKEFCEGFNYEAFIPERSSWSLEAFHLNESHIDLINKNKIRAKYLDREDIESLGFERDKLPAWEDDRDRFLYHMEITNSRHKSVSLFHVPQTNWVLIYFSNNEAGSYVWEMPENKVTFTNGTTFAGVVMNLSELKRILKQIGV